MANLPAKLFPKLRAAVAIALLTAGGCVKQGGEGVVIAKEHIPATVAGKASPDERPVSEERWRVQVEMRADLRKVSVLVEQAAWEKMQIGDRVNVRYSQGKYTGTVWSSEIK